MRIRFISAAIFAAYLGMFGVSSALAGDPHGGGHRGGHHDGVPGMSQTINVTARSQATSRSTIKSTDVFKPTNTNTFNPTNYVNPVAKGGQGGAGGAGGSVGDVNVSNVNKGNKWWAQGSTAIAPGNSVYGNECVNAESWSLGVGFIASISGGHATSRPTTQCEILMTMKEVERLCKHGINPGAEYGVDCGYILARLSMRLTGMSAVMKEVIGRPQPQVSVQPVVQPVAFNPSKYTSASTCLTEARRVGADPKQCSHLR